MKRTITTFFSLVVAMMLYAGVYSEAQDFGLKLQKESTLDVGRFQPIQLPQGGSFKDEGLIYVAPDQQACWCTNLNGVSLICEDCDNETKPEKCFHHDKACQQAAKDGGIREHTTFFCTTGR